jgi:hypothetical protein
MSKKIRFGFITNIVALSDLYYFKNSTLCTVASNKFWSSMSFQNLVRLSQIKQKSLFKSKK